MTKKRNFFSKLISCTLLAAMLLAFALPAFAADYSTGTGPAAEAKAVITKVIKMPINTKNPAVTYTFKLEPAGMNDGTNTTGMPDFSGKPITITFPANRDILGDMTDLTNGYDYVALQSADILTTLHGTGRVNWTHGEGVYKYILRETNSAFASALDLDLEGYENSIARYAIEFWVDKDEKGVLYVKYFCAKTIVEYLDEYYEGTAGDDKVDPKEGGYNQVPKTTIEDDFSQLIFTNKYWKTEAEKPVDPEVPEKPDPDKSTLDIEKVINGNGFDSTVRFDFDVTVTRNAAIPDSATDPNLSVRDTFYAYVVDENGNDITNSTLHGSALTVGRYIEFKNGVLKSIILGQKEKLIFVDLYVGTKVAVEEKGNGDYTPKYKRSFSGTTEYTGEAGKAWGFPRVIGDKLDIGPHFTLDAQNTNHVTFTNTRTGAIPTGISVDNLPYLVLIGIAVAGLLGFVVVKSRRNEEYEA